MTWCLSSHMTCVSGGSLHPPYSFAGLESLDEAAGDRFFLVTKIVIITLNDAKIIQPLVCGWQSVDRGSGMPATLSYNNSLCSFIFQFR